MKKIVFALITGLIAEGVIAGDTGTTYPVPSTSPNIALATLPSAAESSWSAAAPDMAAKSDVNAFEQRAAILGAQVSHNMDALLSAKIEALLAQ